MSVASNSVRHIGIEARRETSSRSVPVEVPPMKISVTGRHMDMTEVLKKYAMSKSERLTHYFDHLSRAEVVFAPEKDGRFSAEIIVHAPKSTLLVVHAQEKSATGAFDLALEKVERQLARLKDKLRGKTKTVRPRRGAAGEAEAVLGDASGDSWW